MTGQSTTGKGSGCRPGHGEVYALPVDPVLAMSATTKCALLLLITGVVAPLVGLLLRGVSGGWESIGKGPLAMEHDSPPPQERSDWIDVEIEAEKLLRPSLRSRDFVGSD